MTFQKGGGQVGTGLNQKETASSKQHLMALPREENSNTATRNRVTHVYLTINKACLGKRIYPNNQILGVLTIA
jgi:hypothetical protein